MTSGRPTHFRLNVESTLYCPSNEAGKLRAILVTIFGPAGTFPCKFCVNVECCADVRVVPREQPCHVAIIRPREAAAASAKQCAETEEARED